MSESKLLPEPSTITVASSSPALPYWHGQKPIVYMTEPGEWPWSYNLFEGMPHWARKAGKRMLAMDIEHDRVVEILHEMIRARRPEKQPKPFPKDLYKKGRIKKPWER